MYVETPTGNGKPRLELWRDGCHRERLGCPQVVPEALGVN